MKILFSGGGTLGPVTPLIAIKETIAEAYPDAAFIWIGTENGPEKGLIDDAGMSFFSIASGKFRRYAAIGNITDILHIARGFFQALAILKKHKPVVCISAGGFVSVPVHAAARVLGIPTWIHQLDVRPGLANSLMAPLASLITTSTEQSVHALKSKKAIWLGNPVRSDIFSGNKDRARKRFSLTGERPVVFVVGGGTGSIHVNRLLLEALPLIALHADIIHLTGKERPQEAVLKAQKAYPHYRAYPFFTEEMRDAYAVADVVVSRGGFGTIAELAALKKPVIFIPIPGHQTDNVAMLDRERAALMLDQHQATGEDLADQILFLLKHENVRTALSSRLHELLPCAKKDEILDLVKKVIEHYRATQASKA